MKRQQGQQNTKNRIIEESLKLFSVYGFDAVSIRTIADAVNIGNSALYKHFGSKQEIFDTIVEISKKKYLEQCTEAVNEEIRGIEQVKAVCIKMFRYQTGDEWIMNFRKMLMLEQFKNPQMAAIYKEFFIDIPIKRQSMIFKALISEGIMADKNPEVMAMELYAPFYMYHTVKRDEKELLELFQTHAEYFFNNYITEGENENAAK